jgi:4-diphosphocytidyl-2-C-methyl-D-erythritol kinase
MMRGIGERIEAVDTRLTLDAVLVNPRLVIPARKTALVFSALAAPPVALTECERPMPTPLDRARLLEFMRRTGNDLTAAALKVMPGIGAVLAALETANGAEIVQLSGAGPTCFAIFPGREDAMHAAARLREDHPRWWIEVTRLGRAASATA